MHKNFIKLKNLIIVSFFMMLHHQPFLAAFTFRSRINLFSAEFLRRTNNDKIANIRVLTQIPLDLSLQDRLLKLKCEDGINISMIVSSLVWDQQKQIIQEMSRDGIATASLPEEYKDLNLQELFNKYKKILSMKFIPSQENKPDMQLALISYKDRNIQPYASFIERRALFGKEQELLVIDQEEENYLVKQSLVMLQNEFDKILRS